MIIVVYKDGSVFKVSPTPSAIYQGSNQASELAVFAPFAVSTYPVIAANIQLPDGEYAEPLILPPAASQPTGFGAWSVLLPSKYTTDSGTLKISLCFYGSGYTETDGEITVSGVKITTEVAEITVRATVPNIFPEVPSGDFYEQLLNDFAAITSTPPDWTQNDVEKLGYIANKPPITSHTTAGAVDGISVNDPSISNGEGKGKLYAGTVDATTVDATTVDAESVTTDTVTVNLPEINGRFSVNWNGNEIFKIYSNTAEFEGIRPIIHKVQGYDAIQPNDIPRYAEVEDAIKGIRLSYASDTGVLTMRDQNLNLIATVDLPTERILSTATYSNGDLVLTFTNGDTVRLPLEDLILPTWTTDIDTTNNAAKSTPPTTEAVKTYTSSNYANAIKGTISGGAVFLEDLDPLYPHFTLKSSIINYPLYYCGRNILNTKADGVTSQNGASYIDTSTLGNIVWKTGGKYYVQIPVYIPKGCTVSYSLKWSAGSGEVVNQFSRVRFSGETVSDFVYDPVQAGILTDTFVASENIYNMLIYKNTSASPLTADVTISEICVNLTDEATYTPFRGYTGLVVERLSEVVTVDSAEAINEGITLIPGRDYPVTMNVEYLRDSTKVIDKLTRKIQALQNAAVT